jgi:hypothetical protein
VPHEGLGEHEWSIQRGLRVTTPERTWLDLASVLGRTQLVIAGDAVSGGLTTVEAIRSSARPSAGGVAWSWPVRPRHSSAPASTHHPRRSFV